MVLIISLVLILAFQWIFMITLPERKHRKEMRAQTAAFSAYFEERCREHDQMVMDMQRKIFIWNRENKGQ